MKFILRKTILLCFLFLGSVMYSNSAIENPTPLLKFKTTYSDTFVLYVTAYDNVIQVKLHNKSGNLLFSETLKKGYAYKKTYDISGLSDGTYYAEVIEGKEVKYFCVIKGNKNKITDIEKLPFE